MKKLLLLLTVILFGCKPEEVPVERNKDVPVAIHEDENFVIQLYSVKDSYGEHEELDIYGTIEYIGENDSIEIKSGNPYMGFNVYWVEEERNIISNFVHTILLTTTLEKGVINKFPLAKSGGYSQNDPDADFWRDFYSEEKMLFPDGTYNLVFESGFYLEGQSDYGVNLEYTFEVK